MLGHLSGALAAAAVLAVCGIVGSWTRDWIDVDLRSDVERVFTDVVFGASILAPLLLLFSWLFGVSTTVCLASIAVVLGITCSAIPVFLHSPFGAVRELKSRGNPRLFWVCVAILVFVSGLALMPPTNWDALTYHLAVPRDWLEAGTLYFPPDTLHSSFVGLPHFLYLPILSVGFDAAAALVSVGFLIVLMLVAHRFGVRYFRKELGGMAGLLVFASPLLVLVAVTARVDATLAAFLLVGHYLILDADESTEASRSYVGAFILGAAVGVKYTALIYIGGVAITYVATQHRQDHAAGAWMREAATMVVVGAFAMSPWMLKNALLHGAPLYPYFTSVELLPWLEPYYPTLRTFGRVPEVVFHIPSYNREPFNLMDFFTDPGALNPEYEARHYFGTFLLLFLPLWITRWRDSRLAKVGGASVIYVAVVLLYSRATNLRYFAPALVPLSLVSVALLAGYARRIFQTRSAVRSVVFGLLLVASLPTIFTLASRYSEDPVFGHLSGQYSRKEYLQQNTVLGLWYGVTESINRTLPDDSKVLLLYESRAYYLENEVIQENLDRNWPILAWTDDIDCLKDIGVTHVVTLQLSPLMLRADGVPESAIRLTAFREFAEKCLRPVTWKNGYAIYEVSRGN